MLPPRIITPNRNLILPPRIRPRRRLEATVARIVRNTGGGSSVGTGFYAAGHWDAAELTMRLVYPRPEARAFARHRWAYYDAVNPIPFRIKIGVMGGAWPFVFEKVYGPSGMSIGRAYEKNGVTYAWVNWVPDGVYVDEPWHIRVTDQEGTIVDVEDTISTSSSTSVFCFVAEANGNDTTGDGSHDNPLRTPLGVFGPTAGALTDFPNAIVYFRAGTYEWYDQTSPLGVQLRKDFTPMSMLAYPGETVTFDITNTGARWLDCSTTDCDDLYLNGFDFIGSTGVTNYRYLFFGVIKRACYGNMYLPNVFAGSNPTDNATFGFFGSNVELHQHIYIHDYRETNRTGGNSGGAFIAFGTQYLLAEDVYNEGSNAGFDCHLKASCLDCEVRESTFDRRLGSGYEASSAQIDNGLVTDRIQFRHIKFLGSTFAINNQFATSHGAAFINRCTLTGSETDGGTTQGAVKVNTNGTGPTVKVKNTVIQANAGTDPIFGNGAGPTYTTVEGDECHGHTSDNFVDSDGNLIGAYRTAHYGTANSRGAEIA